MGYKAEYLLAADGYTHVYDMQRFWNIQSPPFHRPLEYAYEKVYCFGSASNEAGDVGYYGTNRVDLGSSDRQHSAHAGNKCYGALIDSLGSQSQMANNLLEAHQSVDMVRTRAFQLGQLAVALRRGRFGDALKAVENPNHKTPKPGWKPKGKSFGDQWLEYHFGWEPLIQDMHNAVQALSKADFGYHKVRAVGRDLMTYQDRTDSHSGGVTYYGRYDRRVSYNVRMGCAVRVSNPNAYLANQYGVINPLSVAWEAVPYSFVVDWFSNVGQCLSAMTDFVGFDIVDPYTTTSEEISISGSEGSYGGRPVQNSRGEYHGKSIKIYRSYGISGPTLTLKPFNGLSVSRGATAISLLLQKLR